MKTAANQQRMAHVDVSRLAALVSELLGPLYEGPSAPVWAEIEERKRWIGRADRPSDVGFRRMRPRGYAQIAVVNEEDPPSPWTIGIPADLPRRAELLDAVRELGAVCERLYGPGRMHFCVLAVLAPGGQVPVHRDMPHAVHRKAYSHHLLIPLVEAPLVHYDVGDEDFTMEVGGVYEINNMLPHSVVNRGEIYRVNLMIDYCPEVNLPLLDQGEAAHRAAQAAKAAPAAQSASPADPRAAQLPVKTFAAPLELPAEDGGTLHVDLDAVAVKNVVLVPGRRAADVYLEHLFPLFDGAILVSADGSHPVLPALRERVLHALAHDRELAVFVFGWDALARIPVVTDRLCVADEMVASPMCRAPTRRKWSISFEERSLVAWMRSFFGQFDKRGMLGDHSFYYRNHLDWDQDRFDWRMSLLLADPPEEPR